MEDEWIYPLEVKENKLSPLKVERSFLLLQKEKLTSEEQAEKLIKDVIFSGESDNYEHWILKAYNNFNLIKDQACGAYARHTKIDCYGNEDIRKVEKVIVTILKAEGLWESQWSNGWNGHPLHVPIIVGFSKILVNEQSAVLSSPYDKGMKYEDDCKVALEKIGAQVQKTSSGADYGADLTFEYNGCKFVAQCKALNKKAGVRSIQEVVTAQKYYEAEASVTFSILGFSDAAEELATINKVILFSGTDLSSIDRQVAVFL